MANNVDLQIKKWFPISRIPELHTFAKSKPKDAWIHTQVVKEDFVFQPVDVHGDFEGLQIPCEVKEVICTASVPFEREHWATSAFENEVLPFQSFPTMPEVFDIMTALRTTLYVLRGTSFVPLTRSEGRESTVATVRNHLLVGSEIFQAAIADHTTLIEATDILNWTQTLTETALRDYKRSLRIVCEEGLTGGLVEKSALGIICSLPKAYERESLTTKIDQYVGLVGQTLTTECVVTHIRNGVSKTGYAYTMTKCKDDLGRIVTWFSSSGDTYDIGDTLSVTGKVEGHNTFGAQQQTTLKTVFVTMKKECESSRQSRELDALLNDLD